MASDNKIKMEIKNEKNNKRKCVMTIAGTDSGGGAGVSADLKTFAALGVHGANIIASVTAQNTLGVQSVFDIPIEEIEKDRKSVV